MTTTWWTITFTIIYGTKTEFADAQRGYTIQTCHRVPYLLHLSQCPNSPTLSSRGSITPTQASFSSAYIQTAQRLALENTTALWWVLIDGYSLHSDFPTGTVDCFIVLISRFRPTTYNLSILLDIEPPIAQLFVRDCCLLTYLIGQITSGFYLTIKGVQLSWHFSCPCYAYLVNWIFLEYSAIL